VQGFFDSGAFIGDCNGLAVGDGVIYPIWTDGRDSPGSPLGQTDIWTNVELNTFPGPSTPGDSATNLAWGPSRG
jgi:hypothetical protein